MSVDALLSRLDRVKRIGPNRWVACCPAHDDNTPSLAVREVDDGRILIHCFAGCSAEEILRSVGLQFHALFPERIGEHAKRMRRPFNPLQALRCIAFEAALVAVSASNVAHGVVLSEEERLRLHTAAGRIHHALEVALGQ